MRDSYYGISNAWDVTNATHRAQFADSATWLFGHARADGILPQMCPPPPAACNYGNDVCNDTVGAPGWRRCQDLDTQSFAIKLAHKVWAELPAGDAQVRERPAVMHRRGNGGPLRMVGPLRALTLAHASLSVNGWSLAGTDAGACWRWR
jgi:hypothetical protein